MKEYKVKLTNENAERMESIIKEFNLDAELVANALFNFGVMVMPDNDKLNDDFKMACAVVSLRIFQEEDSKA